MNVPSAGAASRRTRTLYWAARATMRQAYRVWPLSDRGIRALGLLDAGFSRLPPPRGVQLSATTLGGVPVEISTPSGLTDGRVGAAILYLHGGGFLFCGIGTHRHVCRSLAVQAATPVHSVGYRQLPEVGVGTAVADAYAAYLALRTRLGDAAHIAVAGDSAGGFLAAKVCELADRDHRRGPDALVCFSPVVDLDFVVDDGPWRTRDALQPASTVRRAQQRWDRGPVPVRGMRALRPGPDVQFPPTFIATARDELLEPWILDFAHALRAAGTPVRAVRQRRAVHAFPVLDRLTPESRATVSSAVAFVAATESAVRRRPAAGRRAQPSGDTRH